MERDQKKIELLQQSLESKRMEREEHGEATIAMIELKGQGINSIKGKEDEMIKLKEKNSILKEEVNR